jgi:hypothetical protein
MENHHVEVGNHPTQLAMWPELSEGTPVLMSYHIVSPLILNSGW